MEDARITFQRAQAAAEQHNAPMDFVDALEAEGLVLEKMEKFKAAIAIYKRQEIKSKEINYEYGIACAIENQATVMAHDLGEKTEAKLLIGRAMEIAFAKGFQDIMDRLWELNDVVR